MRILLTGATGFLGRHLARALVERGDTVVALQRRTSETFRLADLMQRLQVHGLGSAELERLFGESESFDAVVHAATCYGRQGEPPSEILAANLVLPLRLLELARSSRVATFLNIGTSLPPSLNPYALSKGQFAQWGELLCATEATRFLHASLEHFYGPGDDASKFVTHVVRSCLQEVPELALTSGDQRRDFLHVQDAVDALLLLLDSSDQMPRGFQRFELGSGQAIPVRQLVETIHHLCGSRTLLGFGKIPLRPNEVMFSQADISALRQRGWAPRLTLEEGLRRTIEEERSRL